LQFIFDALYTYVDIQRINNAKLEQTSSYGLENKHSAYIGLY